MAEKPLHTTVDLFRAYIRQQNWSIIEEKSVQHGLQLLVTDGQTQTPVTCFATGNALIQGAASPLRTQLQTWWDQQKTVASPLCIAHIGSDEAGNVKSQLL